MIPVYPDDLNTPIVEIPESERVILDTVGEWKLVTKTEYKFAWFKYGIVARPAGKKELTTADLSAI